MVCACKNFHAPLFFHSSSTPKYDDSHMFAGFGISKLPMSSIFYMKPTEKQMTENFIVMIAKSSRKG
jgi:hypothetical protein